MPTETPLAVRRKRQLPRTRFSAWRLALLQPATGIRTNPEGINARHHRLESPSPATLRMRRSHPSTIFEWTRQTLRSSPFRLHLSSLWTAGGLVRDHTT